MVVPVPTSWSGLDDFLSAIALLHLDNMELRWSVLDVMGCGQNVTQIIFDRLVSASDEVLWLQRFFEFSLYLPFFQQQRFFLLVLISNLKIQVCVHIIVVFIGMTPGDCLE